MSEITGILDNSTQEVLILSDDKITLRGNVKIHGVLDVGLVRTTEIISDHRYEKKFLTFVAPENSQIAGTGLLWFDKEQNKQLVYRSNPDRFFLSEHVDLPTGKAYLIDGAPILTEDELGATVVTSNLKKLGTLRELTVGGNVNFGDQVFFNPANQRFSIGKNDGNGIFSIYDNVYDVEVIIEGGDNDNARIGSYNNKGLELITGNQARITVSVSGNIVVGQENKESTIVNLYGKVGVNVKNPQEGFEVAGNIKFQNKLFTTSDRPPEAGTYQKGDIVWNTEPGASKYVGWVCTSSGTPGLWSPFGLIAG
jgi:hypothetical protein